MSGWDEAMAINLGRDICGQLEQALRREWLVTNGLGGYGAGTIGGANTRTYHGLLIAALPPPRRRTLLLAKLDATAYLRGQEFTLATNEWASGAIDPHGYRLLERFVLDGTVPTWTYALNEARLVQRVFMAYGQNTTFVTYHHARGCDPIDLVLAVLCTARDHHGGPAPAAPQVDLLTQGVLVRGSDTAPPLYVLAPGAAVEPLGTWYRGFRYRAEQERGLAADEDLYSAVRLRFHLSPGETATVVATTQTDAHLDGRAALAQVRRREQVLLEQADLVAAPAWVRQLVLAADAFLVATRTGEPPQTVIAGYPWFADWSRDTMIAMPGLCLDTGRYADAQAILLAYGQQVDQGMLPSFFPEAGEAPPFGSVDAALWFVEAVAQWLKATADWSLVRELYPVLSEIVHRYQEGTRHGIAVEADGLLRAGVSGLQLTWMDAKVDDWVVTPRLGKPVEVNALWVQALRTVAHLAATLGHRGEADRLAAASVQARAAFAERFWFAGGYLYDVVDGPHGDDASLRPNQLVACALEPPLLPNDRLRLVVDHCARELHTSLGLRTLAPSDPRYQGVYCGDPRSRDAAYHQGTAWPWFIGPYVLAHLNAYGDRDLACDLLTPFADHLADAGVGFVSEICDGDPPHGPRGCIAQAWSVASVLHAWRRIQLVGNAQAHAAAAT